VLVCVLLLLAQYGRSRRSKNFYKGFTKILHYYIEFNTPVPNVAEARKECAKLAGILATIYSEDKQKTTNPSF